MAGFAIDTEVEPSDGLKLGSEGREGKYKGSLWSLCDDDLVFHDDLALHCGADLPASVLGDLQFKALWSRSSVMSQGDPSRRCKPGHLFTSWSDLVAAADSSGRNRNKRHASSSFRAGELSSVLHPPQV